VGLIHGLSVAVDDLLTEGLSNVYARHTRIAEGVRAAVSAWGMTPYAKLGEVAGKVFRIGHLGMLTDAQMLAGLGVAEMCMADLGYPIELGSGVAAAQKVYRRGDAAVAAMAAE